MCCVQNDENKSNFKREAPNGLMVCGAGTFRGAQTFRGTLRKVTFSASICLQQHDIYATLQAGALRRRPLCFIGE